MPLAVDPLFTVSEVSYSPDWQLVRFTFVATAPFQYITVGNFQDDVHTRVRLFSTTTFPGAYYFFDSFVLKVYDPEEEIHEVSPVSAGADTLNQLVTEAFLEEETPCNFYLPNAFSPDGNGINDYFELYSPCVPQALRVQVFDPSGQIVFASNEPHFRWDGYYNGRPVEPGIYVYIIQATIPEPEGVQNKVWRGTLRVKNGS
ncbi:MAG: gliding motility-associated C-terminal domain-containing protein [Saprospirales bacterium]|nr:gliding motility-associated C-terminal domain-containing protein [Saprospirales bacterium]